MSKEQITNPIDQLIHNMFSQRWVGESVTESLQAMKDQLYKNLYDQVRGYWSGHTAYHIMIEGGFLLDAKHVNGKPKKLTALGEMFMERYELEANRKVVPASDIVDLPEGNRNIIRRARRMLGLNQEKAGQLIGISSSGVHRRETTRNVGIETLAESMEKMNIKVVLTIELPFGHKETYRITNR